MKISNLDLIGSIIGFLVGIIIVILSAIGLAKQIDIGIGMLIVTSIYIVYKDKLKKMVFYPMDSKTNTIKLLSIFFFAFFLVSLIFWYNSLYLRPIYYFVIIATLSGIISIEILYAKCKANILLILLQSLLLSMNISLVLFYNYPSLMGFDEFTHARIAELTAETGHILPFELINKYYYYPIFHIFVAVYKIVLNLDIKSTIAISILMACILSSIFVFIISRKLISSNEGLLAFLLLITSNFFIINSIANFTPGSLVFDYFLLLLYLIFSHTNGVRPVVNIILMIFVGLIITLTHQLTTFVVLVFLLLLYLSQFFHNLFIVHVVNPKRVLSPKYILLLMVLVETYWTTTYVYPGITLFDFALGPIVDAILSENRIGPNELTIGYTTTLPYEQMLIHHLCYLIFPFLAIGGIYLWIDDSDSIKFSISASSSILFYLIYFIPLLGIKDAITHRWMPLVLILLAILTSLYLFRVISLIPYSKLRLIMLFSIIFSFCFLMITTPGIDTDNPLFSKDITIRDQYRMSEINAVGTISKYHIGDLLIDASFSNCFFFYGRSNESSVLLTRTTNNISVFDNNLINGKLDKIGGIVLRKSALDEPISIKKSKEYGDYIPTKLNIKLFNQILCSSDYSMIYDNGYILLIN